MPNIGRKDADYRDRVTFSSIFRVRATFTSTQAASAIYPRFALNRQS